MTAVRFVTLTCAAHDVLIRVFVRCHSRISRVAVGANLAAARAGGTDPVYGRRALSRNDGLTLVEVLTAVSILGILTAVAATNFTAMRPAFRTRGAALAIAGDLNQARMAAIKEARVYEYLPVSGGYQIRRDDGAGGREVVKSVVLANEFPDVVFSAGAVTADPYGAAIGSANAGGTITFHSNGTVQNAASMFVAAHGTDEPIQQAVTLSAAGRVRVWKYSEHENEWH